MNGLYLKSLESAQSLSEVEKEAMDRGWTSMHQNGMFDLAPNPSAKRDENRHIGQKASHKQIFDSQLYKAKDEFDIQITRESDLGSDAKDREKTLIIT